MVLPAVNILEKWIESKAQTHAFQAVRLKKDSFGAEEAEERLPRVMSKDVHPSRPRKAVPASAPVGSWDGIYSVHGSCQRPKGICMRSDSQVHVPLCTENKIFGNK